ncbi:UvrD-helicase domain-containing protein [Oceanobacillus massiliensis]|uniref:UvrD-helicase domain-containing protein n=1 Tax=Oceanobacillus massiliensis TaxID=1465765 RepID=UPI000289BA4B|nr:ATP-dependent helicase [Oceanobacillus massiliensis]
MSVSYRKISSEHLLEDVDKSFKVIAGPGAGKTYWLIQNIKHILRKSNRILPTSKIACITYTNVGANEILKRLEIKEKVIESSTIHSFLYKNLVSPYVYLLTDDDSEPLVDITKMKTHDENIASSGLIYQWKTKYNIRYFDKSKKTAKKIKSCLEDLDWFFDENEELTLMTRKPFSSRIGRYSVRREDLLNYKKYCWSKGIIHHQDVLYFSYCLLESYPVLREILVAKYPYIVLDEFQDTSPIQTKIIKWLSESGAVIGVIGDPAQSIFGFQGASREAFVNFQLPNQKNYIMNQNRRSGENIVSLLNKLRGDEINQTCLWTNIADHVSLIECDGSDLKQTIESFNSKRKELNMNGDYCILARNNPTVSKLKNGQLITPWEDLEQKDSANRYRFLLSLMQCQEYGQKGMIDFAIKECVKAFQTDANDKLKKPFNNGNLTSLQKRSISVSLLEFLITNRGEALKKSVLEFYKDLKTFFKNQNLDLQGVSAGGFKTFSEGTLVKELIDDLKLPEEKDSEIRTIHKSKGAEFESVLVYLEDIEKLLEPDINEKEDETRLLYVACSRAKRFLCIVTPPLDNEERQKTNRLIEGK